MAVLKFKGSNGIIQTIKQIIINSDIDEERIKAEILLAAHPIGSLYWSKDSTDPSLLFGGIWVRVKDKFILAAGDSYSVGATGGRSSVSLTTSELPSHNHTYDKPNTLTAGHRLTLDQIPSHRHKTVDATQLNDGNGAILKWNNKSGYGYQAESAAFGADGCYALAFLNTGLTGGPGNDQAGNNHSHSIGTTSTNSGSKGSGSSFNIMPPYEVFYCWVRVSSTDKTESECKQIANSYISNHINSLLSVDDSSVSYDSTNKIYTWNISNTSYTISVNAVNGGWSHNMPDTVRGNYLIQDYTGNDSDYSFTFWEIMPAGSTSMMGTDISGWYGYEYYNQGSLNGYYYIDISYSEDIEFDK